MKRILIQSRTTEVNAIAGRTIDLFKSSKLSNDANLKQIITELEALYEEQTAAIKIDKETTSLEKLDHDVHESVRALFKMVEGYTYHPEAKIQKAAENIHRILDHYGLGILYKNTASQTALVDSLLNDMKGTEKAASINELSGCPVIVQRLEQAQNALKSSFLAGKKVNQASKSLRSASELRLELMRLINTKLCKYVEVMVAISPDKYTQFTETLTEIFEANNMVVKQRTAKGDIV